MDFQSHGRFHPVLTRCCDEECEIEIGQSRQEIERIVDHECLHFACPFWQLWETRDRVLEIGGLSISADLGCRVEQWENRSVPSKGSRYLRQLFVGLVRG